MPDVLKTAENCPRRFKDMLDGTYSESVAISKGAYFKPHFASVRASSADPAYWTQIGATGSGMSLQQTSGALVITTGTTTNSELILRSNADFDSQIEAKWSMYLSQRVANQLFYFELVDVIGDNLTFTINSAASVTVTFPSTVTSPFNAGSVGQSLNIGAISGAAGIPGRYAIASVSGNSVTFTVASWPASGAGTCSLFGLNFHRVEYSGTTATSAIYDCGRSGYSSGNTTATINTSANPGHMAIINQETGLATFYDMLAASTTTPAATMRASRAIFLPDEKARLVFQIRVQNGTSSPSNTTQTITSASVCDFNAVPVSLTSTRTGPQLSPLNTMILAGTERIGQVDLYSPTAVTDVSSSALTSTTTTSTVTQSVGSTFSIAIPVTAVSGTNPTLDVTIQESDDSSTNWYNTYDFPRITATGIYRSPQLPVTGNRIRYVQTVGGTGSPSFTRSIVRMRSNTPAEALVQMIDRTINFNALNSTTPSLDTRNTANQVKLVVNTGAITTTAPQFQLEGSEDYGSTWVAIGSPLVAVASSTVSTNVAGANWPLLRARVSTAGVGATAGYVLIKGHD